MTQQIRKKLYETSFQTEHYKYSELQGDQNIYIKRFSPKRGYTLTWEDAQALTMEIKEKLIEANSNMMYVSIKYDDNYHWLSGKIQSPHDFNNVLYDNVNWSDEEHNDYDRNLRFFDIVYSLDDGEPLPQNIRAHRRKPDVKKYKKNDDIDDKIIINY